MDGTDQQETERDCCRVVIVVPESPLPAFLFLILLGRFFPGFFLRLFLRFLFLFYPPHPTLRLPVRPVAFLAFAAATNLFFRLPWLLGSIRSLLARFVSPFDLRCGGGLRPGLRLRRSLLPGLLGCLWLRRLRLRCPFSCRLAVASCVTARPGILQFGVAFPDLPGRRLGDTGRGDWARATGRTDGILASRDVGLISRRSGCQSPL